MDTPPGSTLSTPSPTELHDKDPVAAELERADMLRLGANWKSKPIFLVVATTPIKSVNAENASATRLGIGLKGDLPWPSIKADMQFFKNVTQTSGRADPHASVEPLNTVIMGRKTYFSIPRRFRPLDRRHNVILTRSDMNSIASSIAADFEHTQRITADALRKKFGTNFREIIEQPNSPAVAVDRNKLTIVDAKLRTETLACGNISVCTSNVAMPPVTIAQTIQSVIRNCYGQISCIGGAEIYKLFLNDTELRSRLRILQTEIEKLEPETEFECDTFWKEDLSEPSKGWIEADKSEVYSWTGVELPQGADEWMQDSQAGVRIRVKGWKQQQNP